MNCPSFLCRILLTVMLGLLGITPGRCAAYSSEIGDPPHAGQRHTNHFTRAPYVQLATHQSIVVAWRTDGPIHPVVRYGRSPAALEMQTDKAAVVTRVALSTNKAEVKILSDRVP